MFQTMESGIYLKLHQWQAECLGLWAKNNYRGIVNAVTGSGKTVLALSAVRRLHEAAGQDLRIKIVVPQTFLAYQWKDEIKRQLGAASSDIGLYCGKRKDIGRKYMIYVINSARHSLARHILSELSSGRAVFLIADECHHYGSVENNRIFDFLKAAGTNAQYYALGLSATPEIVNFNDITTPLGPEIYYYNFDRALRERIISRFILFSVRLDFTEYERDEYEQLSERISLSLRLLMKKRPELRGMASGRFFAQLHSLTAQESEISELAQTVLNLTYSRKTLCHMAAERPFCALAIVNALPEQSRVILFCERIQSAETLYEALSKRYPKQAGLYHSKMAEHSRQHVLDDFKVGALRLLVCCRALDEGLNIPSTDAGIIVSTSMSARQRVQRLGRMLRRSKSIKQIYYLYIDGSSEDRELVFGLNAIGSTVPLITLSYLGGAFIHTEYERLRENVLEHVFHRRRDPALLGALDKNLDLALLRGDFLLSETICRENFSKARSIRERNYWASVLYVILMRLGKL